MEVDLGDTEVMYYFLRVHANRPAIMTLHTS